MSQNNGGTFRDTGLRDVKTNMKFRVVTMTPEVATELLKNKHARQRKPKDGRINLYCSEILAGYWRLHHQPVAVDEDGFLVDGQNRLEAIVLADTPADLVLVTGVPRSAMVAADQGATRNVADVARMSGKDITNINGVSATARRMASGISSKNMLSIQATLGYIHTHKKALEFAWACMPTNKRGFTHAGVRAVLARAYYQTTRHSRIKEFAEAYISGLVNKRDRDSAVLRFRNWMIDQLGSAKSAPTAWVVYAKCEKALNSFIKREEIERLYETNEELFPVPGEKKWEKIQAQIESHRELISAADNTTAVVK